MTVSIEPPRYSVQFRGRGARKWTTIVTVGSAAVATQTMYDLMSGRSGDWRVSQLPGTCVDTPGVGPSDSKG
jgi:hypothetical protein